MLVVVLKVVVFKEFRQAIYVLIMLNAWCSVMGRAENILMSITLCK